MRVPLMSFTRVRLDFCQAITLGHTIEFLFWVFRILGNLVDRATTKKKLFVGLIFLILEVLLDL